MRDLGQYLIQLLHRVEQAGRYEHLPDGSRPREEEERERMGLLELQDAGYLQANVRDTFDGTIVRATLSASGYRLLREQSAQEGIQTVQKTIDQVPDQFQSTRQHLIQARKQLAELDDPRSRKDAVRDCLSALEALVKSISGANDIKAGVTVLRGQEFGADEILREIQTVWQHLHQGDFRDVRHGQAIVHELDQAEALYWIERVLALVNYLSRLSTAPSGTGSATTPT